jgi:prefoldin subunit 5
MPGKLVNTNEIMVYLGGEIFAKQSAHEAREIINRRRTGNDESMRQVEELLGEHTIEHTRKVAEKSSEIRRLLQERKEEVCIYVLMHISVYSYVHISAYI